MRVDLLYVAASDQNISWELGVVKYLGKDLFDAKNEIESYRHHLVADFVLVINLDLFELPDEQTIINIVCNKPGELWHIGLKCYQGKVLKILDYIRPTWIYSLNPPDNISCTSWYLSAECLLAKAEVLQSIELFDTSFETVGGAGIDWGFRLFNSGVIIRYEPLLSVIKSSESCLNISVFDEFRFVKRNFSFKWHIWSAFRYSERYETLKTITAVCRNILIKTRPVLYYKRSIAEELQFSRDFKVSVLAPTLERYSYLIKEIEQLRFQTIKPYEIIITDQTDPERRRSDWLEKFRDLNIHYKAQDEKGQCYAWNYCISHAGGDVLLFLGDDADEIKPDFIRSLLDTMLRYKTDMVACNIRERDNDYPYKQNDVFITDIFPICLVKRTVFEEIGDYDLAFNNGARADGDIAIRMHLNGKLMLLNPNIRIYHHRAPIGGLRVHSARVSSRADARKRINLFNLPSVTELYLSMKHFDNSHLAEIKRLKYISLMSYEGNILKKILKVLVFCINYKKIKLKIENNELQAHALFNHFPVIPNIRAK